MKKLLLSAVLAASMGAMALAPQSAQAADGTITISGTVLAQTCTVEGKSYQADGTLSSPADKTVNLPNVLAPVLNSPGSTSSPTGFQINIAGCDAGLNTVATTFSGSQIDGTNNQLTSTGTATNVNVQLLDSTQKLIPLTNGYTMAPVNLVGGAATLSYYARYYSKNGNAGAGTVNTTVAFTLSYQ